VLVILWILGQDFFTLCIRPIKQSPHYVILSFSLVVLWRDTRESAEKRATRTTLSYHIWKVASRSIVTNVTRFTVGAQRFVAQVSPILCFVSHLLLPMSHHSSSRHFSHRFRLVVSQYRRNRLSRYVTADVTHGHAGACCCLARAMDFAVGQHKHTSMGPFFF